MSGNRLAIRYGSRAGKGLSVRLVDLAVLLIVGLSVSFLLSSAALSAPPTEGQPSASQPVNPGQSPNIPKAINKPDLTATITFIPKNPYQKEGVTCYSIQPVILITNHGKSFTQPFEYVAEWSFSTTPNAWQVFTLNTVNGLGAGQSHTVVGANNAASALTWCPTDPGTPGYRVTIDAKDWINEGSEHNNIVEERYTPIPSDMRKFKKVL